MEGMGFFRNHVGVAPTECLSGPISFKLRLHPQERELRDQRRRWAEPKTQRFYRRRGEGEGLVHTMTRHGCRKARAWGLGSAQVQAHTVAIACDLKLMAASLA